MTCCLFAAERVDERLGLVRVGAKGTDGDAGREACAGERGEFAPFLLRRGRGVETERTEAPPPGVGKGLGQLLLGRWQGCGGDVGGHTLRAQMRRHRPARASGAGEAAGARRGERRVVHRARTGEVARHLANLSSGRRGLARDILGALRLSTPRPALNAAVQDTDQPGFGRCEAGEVAERGLAQGVLSRRRAGGLGQAIWHGGTLPRRTAHRNPGRDCYVPIREQTTHDEVAAVSRFNPIGTMIAATLLAFPVLADEAAQPPTTPPAAATSESPDASPQPSAPPQSPASSPSEPSAPSSPTGVVATTDNPNLAVATLRLTSGVRAGKIIGEAVQNEQNQRVGTVDDLILSPESKVTMAVVSVGGFLGMGSKLVAVPWPQLKAEGDHLVLPGATKASLNAAPNFQY